MGIINDIAAAKVREVRCATCAALESMDEADANAVRGTLRTRAISYAKLAAVLNRNGFRLSDSSLQRHVNQEHDAR